VMFVGADVGHPGPGSDTRPSVTSLVASVDAQCTRYTSVTDVQSPRVEIIETLGVMLEKVLRDYYDFNNKKLPQTMVFFRDGVSEGEFQEVAQKELTQIDEVFSKLGAVGPAPQVVFIIVGKRHHIRFFPLSEQQADKTGNCIAGFVVDKEINNPNLQDYYLQSHSGIQGTSRPAHYIVLRNDPKWDADRLQSIAFALCHVHASSTRSVSIPAPVYYADLACTRVDFIFNQDQSDTATATSGGSKGDFDVQGWKDRTKFDQSKLNRFLHFL